MKICEFSFNVVEWNIVCDKEISADDWRLGAGHWQQNSKNWQAFSPKLAFLPALKRRRLSESARLFFESAYALQDSEQLPVVYASQNSEINRSFSLWQSLLQEGDISPTSFSLSVHNALVGQWSELRQAKGEMTALTAQQDNLEIALLEAYLLLQEGQQKVLVVVAESPLAEQYNASPITRPPFGYALAMVVEQGTQYQLSLVSEPSENADKNCDNALTWVWQQHLQSTHWQTQSHSGAWLWHKN